MTITYLRWRLRLALRSIRNGWHTRFVLLLALGGWIAGAYVGATWLQVRVANWQSLDSSVLATRLLFMCALTWVSLFLLSLLGAIRIGYGRDARLLLSLPLSAATRLRTLYVELLLNYVAPLGVSVAFGFLFVPLQTAWLLFLLAGLLFVPLLSLLTMASGRLLWVSKRRWWLLVLTSVFGIAVLVALYEIALINPLWVAVGILFAVLLALGPCATLVGKLYVLSYATDAPLQATHVVSPPDRISRWVAGWRNLTAALLLRGWLSRWRSPLTWLRLAVLPLYVAVIGWLSRYIETLQFSSFQWTVGGVSLLLLLYIVDSQTSPLGSEGGRLTHLLVTNSIDRILVAKWWAFFLPHAALLVVLLPMVATASRLPMQVWPEAFMLVGLLFVALTTLYVFGSAADINLTAIAQGTAETFILEEAPFTPVRLALSLSALVLVAFFLVIIECVKSPLLFLLLALLNGVLYLVLRQVARRWLRSVV